jgi:hypothetical protein
MLPPFDVKVVEDSIDTVKIYRQCLFVSASGRAKNLLTNNEMSVILKYSQAV